MAETELVLYCDFHGHSRKQNIFLYGCENKQSPAKRLRERVFPAMLSKNDPPKVILSIGNEYWRKLVTFSLKFSFNACKFKVQKHKEGTGRVVMWNLGIMNSFTLEVKFLIDFYFSFEHETTKSSSFVG